MRRSFRPSLNGLESRELLTTGIAPTPPHQLSHNLHTGSILGGQVDLQTVDAGTDAIDAVNATTYTGTGTVNIAGRKVMATIRITIGEDQSFSLFITDDQGESITASGLSLANQEAGNYRVTESTGAWSNVAGMGVWYLATDSDGNANFVLNPHQ